MPESLYQPTTPEISERRKTLAPGIHEAFENFSRSVFADGALPEKTKQLIAVAVAHVTQCPYCITGHTKLARRTGANRRKSWKPSGSRRKCGPVVRSHTPRWP